jgi:predicted Zn-dependent peptidase
VRISFPTFGEHDPRYVALQLLARVLDDGMSTRVHRRICDEKGLAYEAFAGLDPYEDCGVLDLGAAVEHGKTAEVVKELLKIVRELREQPPTARELDKAKRRFTWELRALQDEAAGMAAHHGTAEIFHLPDNLDATAARVQQTTAQDILAVARAIFIPDSMTLACVGVLSRPNEIPKIAASVLS